MILPELKTTTKKSESYFTWCIYILKIYHPQVPYWSHLTSQIQLKEIPRGTDNSRRDFFLIYFNNIRIVNKPFNPNGIHIYPKKIPNVNFIMIQGEHKKIP